MESINNSNNINIELAHQQKKKQFQKIKKVLKSALKCMKVNMKASSKKSPVEDEIISEINDNNFNEMLERRMEDQQNLLNEQISGQQEASNYCFVENDNGKFYWSSDINRFVAVDRDLIEPRFCSSAFQQAQIQCC